MCPQTTGKTTTESRDVEVSRLAELLNLCWDAIILTDLSDRIAFWNRGAERMYGWTREEALGWVSSDLFKTESDVLLEGVNDVSVREGHWEGELRHRCKDGGQIVVLSRWTVQHGEAGEPCGWMKVNTDITQRKEGELALNREREFSRRLIESSTDAISTFDQDLRITLWNRAMEKLTGIQRNEAVGRSVDEVLGFLKKTGENGFLEAALHGDSVSSHDRPYWIAATNRSGFFEARYSPIYEDAGMPEGDGKIIGGLAVMRDITEERKNDEALRKLSARLLQIQDQERRRIARELHDGTTQMLSNIKLNLEVLRRGRKRLQGGDILDETIAMAGRAAQELRTTSYLLHPPELDIIGLAGATRSFVKGFSERTGIKTIIETAPDLERLPQDVETALFRILQESLTNVHRHSQSSSAEVKLYSEGRYIIQEIRDFGRGMTTIDQSSHSEAPLGVGIAGMHARVRQLGGVMRIESDSRGTLVQVKVPFKQAGSESKLDGE